MAGHTSEKRWRNNQNPLAPAAGVSSVASSIVKQVLDALTTAEAAFAEMSEMYAYAGGTVQLLADQLFKEDWEARSAQGVQAVITVTVTAGVVGTPVVTTAGTGYVDGTGFQLILTATAGGGDGAAILEYDVVSGAVTNVSVIDGGTTYADGAGQTVQETPAAGLIFETEANADEVAKAQDLFNAVTAMHELHQAADNVVVVQEDRYAQMRRMS